MFNPNFHISEPREGLVELNTDGGFFYQFDESSNVITAYDNRGEYAYRCGVVKNHRCFEMQFPEGYWVTPSGMFWISQLLEYIRAKHSAEY